MIEFKLTIEQMEDLIPTLAGEAVSAAYNKALASGQSVLEVKDGIIYEVFPNGSQHAIKKIEPSVPVENGAKINIE